MINNYLYITNKTERAITQSVSNIHIKYSNMNTEANVQEIWKDIPNYEGYYQISNLGEVKSIEKKVRHKKEGSLRIQKGRVLKQTVGTTGYFSVSLYKKSKRKTIKTHQLVAMAFLNHIPCGYKMVVDHIDNNPLNNNLNNLQIITVRKNNSKDKTNGSSKYIGVYWSNKMEKWCSAIQIGGKNNHLGVFKDEYKAHLAYESKLKEILNGR